MDGTDEIDENALIQRYIEENPLQPGPADARLKDYGTALWALISYLDRAVDGDIEQAAVDYDVPVEAVHAALAYYRRHQAPIDARILLNAV